MATSVQVNNATLDLVVERFEFHIKGNFIDKHDSLLAAARRAETLLYHDIYGALFYDLIEGWGKKSVSYPVPPEHFDGVACFSPNWHIPPHEYEDGIRWKPHDRMQQFDIQVEAAKGVEGNYQGVVKLVAYVWDDHAGFGDGRLGCLLDIVDRNTDTITLAETARISIPMNKNPKEQIDDANLFMYGSRQDIGGFEFPSDEIGDTSHIPINFTPVDVKERHRECQYRDR